VAIGGDGGNGGNGGTGGIAIGSGINLLNVNAALLGNATQVNTAEAANGGNGGAGGAGGSATATNN